MYQLSELPAEYGLVTEQHSPLTWNMDFIKIVT